MKKINAFGKSIPVIAVIAMLLTAGIAGAALVSVYFTVTGTVNVQEPLSVDPSSYTIDVLTAGDTYGQTLTISNAASVPIKAEMKTTVKLPDGTIIEEPTLETDGICVLYGDIHILDIQVIPWPEPPQLMTFGTGETSVTAWIRTNPALKPGNYTITTNAVPSALARIAE